MIGYQPIKELHSIPKVLRPMVVGYMVMLLVVSVIFLPCTGILYNDTRVFVLFVSLSMSLGHGLVSFGCTSFTYSRQGLFFCFQGCSTEGHLVDYLLSSVLTTKCPFLLSPRTLANFTQYKL